MTTHNFTLILIRNHTYLMKKYLLCSFLYLGLVWGANAQEKLNELTQERAVMYQEYLASEEKASGFFGNRTKDDMQNSIEALKKIIAKDNEILEELKNTQAQAKAELTEKYNELIQQNNELTEQNRELLALTEKHKGWSKENHSMLESVESKQSLVMGLGALFGFLFFVYFFKYFSLKSKYKRLQREEA